MIELIIQFSHTDELSLSECEDTESSGLQEDSPGEVILGYNINQYCDDQSHVVSGFSV